MTTRLIAVTVASLLALAACGSDDSSSDGAAADTTEAPASEPAGDPDPEPADAAAGAEITIADFAFGDPITVAAGAEVTVTNADGAPHSVTASEAVFTSGILEPGTSGSFTAPDAPGTYAFFCAVHPSMTGELVVS